jgi:hypothetical protein
MVMMMVVMVMVSQQQKQERSVGPIEIENRANCEQQLKPLHQK